MDNFLNNLEKIRNYKDWNMDAMYENLAFGKTTLHEWKTGKSKPNLDTLERIAENSGFTVAELLFEGFEPEKSSEKSLERYHEMDELLRHVHSLLRMELSGELTLRK